MGSPTRFGNIASQLKQFLDTLGPQWAQGLLADKVYSGFTTTDTDHGGQESTLLALYATFHHFGGVVVAPGYTHPVKFADGNPYGSSHVGRRGEHLVTGTSREAARYQGARIARVAAALKGGFAPGPSREPNGDARAAARDGHGSGSETQVAAAAGAPPT